MLILNREHLEPLISWEETISLMKEVFLEFAQGKVVMPERSAIHVGEKGNSILFMPAFVPSAGGLGIKLVSIFPTNQGGNTPTVTSKVLMVDDQTGVVKAILDGVFITALRTAAVSALATDLLSRKDSSVLGVFGAGIQAKHHILAIQNVRSLKTVLVFDSNKEKAQQLCKELTSSNPQPTHRVANSPDSLVIESHIIVTATTATTPVFDGNKLKPGTHITAIGSFKPNVRELDDATMKRSRIFVDISEEAMKEAGDILIPLGNGTLKGNPIAGELGDLVTGKVPGRRNDEEITVFKSVGAAMEDIIVAAALLRKAGQKGIGSEVS